MSLMIYPSYIPNANANKKANSQVGEIPIQKPCHKITPCLASPPLEVPVLIGLQNWHAEHPSDATDALGTLGAEDTSEKHMKIYIYKEIMNVEHEHEAIVFFECNYVQYYTCCSTSIHEDFWRCVP
jgi:hypothetical protein